MTAFKALSGRPAQILALTFVIAVATSCKEEQAQEQDPPLLQTRPLAQIQDNGSEMRITRADGVTVDIDADKLGARHGLTPEFLHQLAPHSELQGLNQAELLGRLSEDF